MKGKTSLWEAMDKNSVLAHENTSKGAFKV